MQMNLFNQPVVGMTVTVAQKRCAKWTGTIADVTPTTENELRYEILPNDDCPIKDKLHAWETIRVYSTEIAMS